MSESKPSREIAPPVQFYKQQVDDEGNRSPVQFFGPKAAAVPNPVKKRVRTNKATKAAPVPDVAEKSAPAPRPIPTSIPESDSSK